MRLGNYGAALDGGAETRGDTTFAHVTDQRVDGGLPFSCVHLLRKARVSQYSGIALRQRDEDQHAGPMPGMADAAQDELLERRAMGARTPQRARDQRQPQRHPREDQPERDEYDDLDENNPLHAPCSEFDQRPGRQQRQHGRPDDRDVHVIGRRMCQHTYELSAGLLFRCGYCGSDGGMVLGGKRHHQLPEAPPPPDDPPPPENPPPKPPPEEPPQEPPS